MQCYRVRERTLTSAAILIALTAIEPIAAQDGACCPPEPSFS
jgi:hypothetical protein